MPLQDRSLRALESLLCWWEDFEVLDPYAILCAGGILQYRLVIATNMTKLKNYPIKRATYFYLNVREALNRCVK